MTYNIQYKQGDVDTVGNVLSDDDGVIDLSGKTVTLAMVDVATESIFYEIDCILGGWVKTNGILTYYSAARGGVTAQFSAVETLTSGEFKGEFVVVGSTSTVHIPSGNNYLSIMIWEKVGIRTT